MDPKAWRCTVKLPSLVFVLERYELNVPRRILRQSLIVFYRKEGDEVMLFGPLRIWRVGPEIGHPWEAPVCV